jgi:hypothetical protein
MAGGGAPPGSASLVGGGRLMPTLGGKGGESLRRLSAR